MDNNSNFPQNPAQPPNQNPNPPIPPYDQEITTRKTLYLVAFIFSILATVAIGLAGLITLIQGFVFKGMTNEGPDELDYKILASVYIIVGVICLGLLIWLIIATVFVGRYRLQVGTKDEKQHLAFAICILIFGNLVAGILLIIANSLIPKQYY